QSLVQFASLFCRVAIDRFGQTVQPCVKRIQQDQTLLSEQSSKQFSERAGVTLFRRITTPKQSHEIAGSGTSQHDRSCPHDLSHLRTKLLWTDGIWRTRLRKIGRA